MVVPKHAGVTIGTILNKKIRIVLHIRRLEENKLPKRNNSSGKIEVSKEVRQEMIEAIKVYFLQEREEDLGDLAASFILDFFMEKLAPHAYNQGINDAYKFISEKTEDLLGIQKY